MHTRAGRSELEVSERRSEFQRPDPPPAFFGMKVIGAHIVRFFSTFMFASRFLVGGGPESSISRDIPANKRAEMLMASSDFMSMYCRYVDEIHVPDLRTVAKVGSPFLSSSVAPRRKAREGKKPPSAKVKGRQGLF